MKGRKITLGECRFIFKKVWSAVCKDLTTERDFNKVYINDLFHILDLAGTLMNKAEPTDND